MSHSPADVLIIGSGIMGSAAARLLREARPATGNVMVDGGPAIEAAPSMHLHDVLEPELWAAYNAKVTTGVQGFYAGANPTPTAATGPAELEPGMHLLSALHDESAAMPMDRGRLERRWDGRALDRCDALARRRGGVRLQ